MMKRNTFFRLFTLGVFSLFTITQLTAQCPTIDAPTTGTTNYTICQGDAIPDFGVEETTLEEMTTYQLDDGSAETGLGVTNGSITWGNMFLIDASDCNNGCTLVSFDAGFGLDADSVGLVGNSIIWYIYGDDDGDPISGLSAPLATGTHIIANDDIQLNGVLDNVSVGSVDICSTIATYPYLFISLSDPNDIVETFPAGLDQTSTNGQSWVIIAADGTQADWSGGFFLDDVGFPGNWLIRANLGCQTACATNWYDALTGGNSVGTGTIFNADGATGEEGTMVDTNTPSTYTFYAEADCGSGCLSDTRTQISLIVESATPQCVVQDFSLQLDAMGGTTITAADIDNGSIAGCTGVLNLSLDITDFTCDNVGENTITFTADDGSGNSSTCTATVTVMDNNCPDPPTAEEVPTVGEWGLIMLGLLMFIVAVVGIRQKAIALE